MLPIVTTTKEQKKWPNEWISIAGEKETNKRHFQIFFQYSADGNRE